MRSLCAAHNKTRSIDCLQENPPGSGIYVCVPGFECKGGGGAGAQGAMMCQLHGKKRSIEALVDIWTPNGVVFQCRPEMQCKIGAAQRFHPYAQGNPFFPQFAIPGAPGPQMIPGVQVCLVHNKRRSLVHLQMHPTIPGAYVCRADSECKFTGPGGHPTAHLGFGMQPGPGPQDMYAQLNTGEPMPQAFDPAIAAALAAASVAPSKAAVAAAAAAAQGGNGAQDQSPSSAGGKVAGNPASAVSSSGAPNSAGGAKQSSGKQQSGTTSSSPRNSSGASKSGMMPQY